MKFHDFETSFCIGIDKFPLLHVHSLDLAQDQNLSEQHDLRDNQLEKRPVLGFRKAFSYNPKDNLDRSNLDRFWTAVQIRLLARFAVQILLWPVFAFQFL